MQQPAVKFTFTSHRHIHAWHQQRSAPDGKHSRARLLRSDDFLASAGGYAAPGGHVKSAWYTTLRKRPDVNTASQTRSRAVSITWRRRAETAGSRRWTADGIAETTCTMCAARAHVGSLARLTPHSKPLFHGNKRVAATTCDSQVCQSAVHTRRLGPGPSCWRGDADRHLPALQRRAGVGHGGAPADLPDVGAPQQGASRALLASG